MSKKYIVLSALAGAMVSFVLNSANSAPAGEMAEKPLGSKMIQAGRESSDSQNKKVYSLVPKKTEKNTVTKIYARKSAKTLNRRTLNAVNKSKATRISLQGKRNSVALTSHKAKTTQYSQIINLYAKTYGVPASLAHAVVRHESNFQPNVRGRAGEIGLMQIKLSTARGLGYSGSAKGLYEPSTNVQYGMKYLAIAQKLGGGSTCGTILKYNAGHGAKRMNPTSARYCSQVKAYMGSL